MFGLGKLKGARLWHQLVLPLAAALILVSCLKTEPDSVTSTVAGEAKRPTRAGPADITPTTLPPPATLTPITPSLTTPPILESQCLFSPYGIGGEVPVFAQPDWDSLVLDEIVMGDRYPVLERGGEWYVEGNSSRGQYIRIQLDDRTTGWVINMRGGLEGSCAEFQEGDEISPPVNSTMTSAATTGPTSVDGDPVPALPGIIYENESGTWQVMRSGEHKRITTLDGQQLSTVLSYGLEITAGDVWIHDLDSGDSINVTDGSGRSHVSAAWWAERPGTLVLSSKAAEDEGPNHGRLTLVDSDGANYRVIQAESSLASAAPAPSPDGKTISFDAGLKGMLYTLDGQAVTFDPDQYRLPDGVQVAVMGSPSWSPDGDRLAWMMGVTGSSYSQGESWDLVLGIFDLLSGDVDLIHPYQPVGRGGWLPPAVWSPDGQWLTFSVEAQDESQRGLWVTAADGTVEYRLSPLSSSQVIWSPPGNAEWSNGKRLLLTESFWKEESQNWLLESGTWLRRPLVEQGAKVIGWRSMPLAAVPGSVIKADP